MIRALNYHHGLQDFTVIVICKFERIFEVASSLKADNVQVAVCGISAKYSGMYIYLCTLITVSARKHYYYWFYLCKLQSVHVHLTVGISSINPNKNTVNEKFYTIV